MRYEVWSCFGKRKEWTLILSTDDRDRAVQCTNFWDERQNTWLYDLNNMSFSDHQARADIRFNNAISRLEAQKELMPKLRALLNRPSPFDN